MRELGALDWDTCWKILDFAYLWNSHLDWEVKFIPHGLQAETYPSSYESNFGGTTAPMQATVVWPERLAGQP